MSDITTNTTLRPEVQHGRVFADTGSPDFWLPISIGGIPGMRGGRWAMRPEFAEQLAADLLAAVATYRATQGQ